MTQSLSEEKKGYLSERLHGNVYRPFHPRKRDARSERRRTAYATNFSLLAGVGPRGCRGCPQLRLRALQPDLGDVNTRSQPELIERRPTMVWPLQTGPSSYRTYEQTPGSPCCCPIGSNGPIRVELFTNTGRSRVDGELIAHSLDTGWLVEGGGRTLFFNQDATATWNIDLGLSYVWNHGAHPLQTPFPARTVTTTDEFGITTESIVSDKVTVDNVYRTYVSIGGGREWYLMGSDGGCGSNWVVGVDGGFRYGCAPSTFTISPLFRASSRARPISSMAAT